MSSKDAQTEINENPERLIKTPEAAEMLGVSAGFLRVSRLRGELYKGTPTPKFVKMGSAVRYKLSTINEWIENQTLKNTKGEVK